MSVPYASRALRDQERVSHPLELELRDDRVVAGNQTQILYKSSKFSWPLSHLSIPMGYFEY